MITFELAHFNPRHKRWWILQLLESTQPVFFRTRVNWLVRRIEEAISFAIDGAHVLEQVPVRVVPQRTSNWQSWFSSIVWKDRALEGASEHGQANNAPLL